jgi:hypothetical protein
VKFITDYHFYHERRASRSYENSTRTSTCARRFGQLMGAGPKRTFTALFEVGQRPRGLSSWCVVFR